MKTMMQEPNGTGALKAAHRSATRTRITSFLSIALTWQSTRLLKLESSCSPILNQDIFLPPIPCTQIHCRRSVKLIIYDAMLLLARLRLGVSMAVAVLRVRKDQHRSWTTAIRREVYR